MLGISYWFIPLLAGCAWLGGLLAMLALWVTKGSPTYPWQSEGQVNPYISDLGATGWGKPIFIATSAVMVVAFDTAFIAERWLRHRGRLTHNYGMGEKILSVLAIVFALAGAAGLILLTIFDTAHYPRTHDSMLGLFILAYVISAIFICAEYQRLGIHYRQYRVLRISFWIKLAFILVEVGLAIAFGVMMRRGESDVAAILEWIVALIYIFYIWSFIIDFLPATHTKQKSDRFPPVRRADDPEPGMTQAGGNMLGGPVYTNGGDSHAKSPPQNVPASRNF